MSPARRTAAQTAARQALTKRTFAQAIAELARRDRDLAAIISRFGQPPLVEREPGFASLVQIILEQQVSLASARATFARLLSTVSALTPQRFLELDDRALRTAGFSRQKMQYCRALAEAIDSRRLSLEALQGMPDDEVRAQLCQLKGIGRWTADIYLLLALQRPDIWLVGDLALALAVQHIKQLEQRPAPAALEALGEPWRPWRGVATSILWHHYLSRQ